MIAQHSTMLVDPPKNGWMPGLSVGNLFEKSSCFSIPAKTFRDQRLPQVETSKEHDARYDLIEEPQPLCPLSEGFC